LQAEKIDMILICELKKWIYENQNDSIFYDYPALYIILGGVGCDKELTCDNVPYAECDCVEKVILRSNHSIKDVLF